jgi:hypothetical protein
MVYLLQAEEREISYELLQDLAMVLAESPEVVFADATRKVHTSHGIMEFESRAEAERVSARVAGLGFRTFIVDHLLAPPEPERLDPAGAQIAEEIELGAAARVDTVDRHKVTTFNPLRLRIAYPRIPIPSSVIDEEWVEDRNTEYSLDLFAGPRHWRLQHASAGPFVEFLQGLALSTATLGAGARSLLAGSRNLPRFSSEKDYQRYLTWLYQLRYAER